MQIIKAEVSRNIFIKYWYINYYISFTWLLLSFWIVSIQISQISIEDDDSDKFLEYSVEFCGFFPADQPKYSIIVSMNKMGLPASGGLMAGSVFSEIVNYMVAK